MGVRQRANELLLEEIRQVHAEHQERMGSPRVTQELRRRGRRCGRHRVARLMKRHGLRARRKRAFRPKTTQPGNAPSAKVLAQMGPPPSPDRVWVSDISYIATREGWLYLAVVLDLFSRKVLGWALQETMQSSLVEPGAPARHARAPAGPGLVLSFRSRRPVRQRGGAHAPAGDQGHAKHERQGPLL